MLNGGRGDEDADAQFDVDVHVNDIDPDLLHLVFDDEVGDEGIGDNRLYFNVTGTTRPGVESVIEAEEALIMSVAETATDVDEFDRLIEQAMDSFYPVEDIDEGPLSDLSTLDLGVISAVAALAAAEASAQQAVVVIARPARPTPLSALRPTICARPTFARLRWPRSAAGSSITSAWCSCPP